MFLSQQSTQEAFCRSCNCIHTIPRKPALSAAKDLMRTINQELGTDYLNGEARGKMFGVLVCQTPQGKNKTLKAFSGQYNGQWLLEDWVPPLFDVEAFHTVNDPVEKQIKILGRDAERNCGNTMQRTLLQERKQLSRKLMRDIHALYTLHNFKGQKQPLSDFFPQDRGIPTGAGDCCAPKLLNHAAIHELQPLGLAEFYWGRTNKSVTRHEGQFYLACKDKCDPILGFLLCGTQKKTQIPRTLHR